MIIKIDKGNYILVKSDEGKLIRFKGQKQTFSEATELKSHSHQYEEVE